MRDQSDAGKPSLFSHITTARIEALGYRVEIPLVLSFGLDNPVGVCMEFDDPANGLVVWWVDRLLVTEGLEGPAGAGDVQIWPVDTYKDRVYVSLSSDEGEATVTVSAHEVRTFLEGAERVLPLGAEELAIQAELDAWLGELLSMEE